MNHVLPYIREDKVCAGDVNFHGIWEENWSFKQKIFKSTSPVINYLENEVKEGFIYGCHNQGCKYKGCQGEKRNS